MNDKIIYSTYIGSKALGLYMSEEEFGEQVSCDIDVMEISVKPLEFYLGTKAYSTPQRKRTKVSQKDEWDITTHELQKVMILFSKGNPNMLLPLFVDEDMIIKNSKAGRMLRKARDAFLGRDNIRDRFIGYATSQLKRSLLAEEGAYQGYMGDRRKKMVDKFGYDTKYAMTAIRLLDEAQELLLDRTFTVDKRKNGKRDFYLGIRLGKFSLEEVKDMIGERKRLVDEAYEKSGLPNKIDTGYINDLTAHILKEELVPT
jgi:predicted nucleotidyltransferase